MTRCSRFAVSLSLASLLFGAASYKLIKTISIPGYGGWDYAFADSQNRRLYVSHCTEVDVLNLDTAAIVGKIPNTNGVHGIAVANDLDRGFISDGRDNQVTIFNLKNLETIATVKAGTNPDAIVYDPFSRRVFAFNGRSHDLTAIDAASGKVAGTMALDGKPEFAASDTAGNMYVNIEDKSELVRFDPRTLQIRNRWPLSPACDSPSGLAIDTANHRLFPVCENRVMVVVDADSGKIVSTVPTGAGTDAAAFDPAAKLAFASNGRDATLTIVREESPDKYSVVENAKTELGARTMAIDLNTHTVYLPDSEFGPAPAPTSSQPHPRPHMMPGTFKLLVMSRSE